MQIGSIIADLGGTSQVAALCGVQSSAVSNWKARNSVPPEYWAALVNAARERGLNEITFEAFALKAAKEPSEVRA